MWKRSKRSASYTTPQRGGNLTASTGPALPTIAGVLSPMLAAVPVVDQPLLLALSKRIAAGRCRSWAENETDTADRTLLLGCAERYDEIASRIESLRPDAKTIQQRLLREHPIAGKDHELFSGRPVPEQYAIQARADRMGLSTWKAVAGASRHQAVRALFTACAELEEHSAMVLETLLARPR